MKPEDKAELERRNKMSEKLILEKLDNIDKKLDKNIEVTERNDRALRGINGKPGLTGDIKEVKNFMKANAAIQTECATKFELIHTTLHGKGKEVGIVAEQTFIRRINKWLIGIATSILVGVVMVGIKLWVAIP